MQQPFTNRSTKLIRKTTNDSASKPSQLFKKLSNSEKQRQKEKLSYFEKLKLMIGRRSYLDTMTQQIHKSRSRSAAYDRGTSIKKNRILPKGLSKPKNILTTQNSIPQQKKIPPKQQKKEIVNYDGKFEPVVQSGIKTLQLKQIIGTGANATVRKALINCNQLAVKVYEKYKLIEPTKMKAVFKQIKLMKKLNFPDIIRFYGAHQSTKQIHVLMEYFEGKTLYQYMRQCHFNLPLNLCLRIIQKLSSVLYYLHEQVQIAHRDLKLDNILISNNLQDIRVIDFGYATSTSNASQNSCGTPNYMAPQLFNKSQSYDSQKVDMWSFGVIIYHLTEGIFPFRGYDQKDLIRRIKQRDLKFKKTPMQLQDIITGLLQLDPNIRTTALQLRGVDWKQYETN